LPKFNSRWFIAGAALASLFFLKQHFNGGVYRKQPLRLEGKYAVVTGGNSGIGA
jgi:hypothetical protein